LSLGSSLRHSLRYHSSVTVSSPWLPRSPKKAVACVGEQIFNGLCHCKNCTLARGVSPVHIIAVSPADSVQILEGADALQEFVLPNGGTVSRVFCKNCGSLVHQGPIGANFRAVVPTTFQRDVLFLSEDLQPKRHFNYESRLYNHHDDLPKHEGFPSSGKQLSNTGEPI
jgi:hypothetical protein